MATVSHACLYGGFIDTEKPQEKEIYRTNQGSNFLGGSFSNRDNVRATIQFGRECQTQHLQEQTDHQEQTDPFSH